MRTAVGARKARRPGRAARKATSPTSALAAATPPSAQRTRKGEWRSRPRAPPVATSTRAARSGRSAARAFATTNAATTRKRLIHVRDERRAARRSRSSNIDSDSSRALWAALFPLTPI
jgi:hypothetical protein